MLLERRDDQIEPLAHREGESLDDEMAFVAVHDQAGQAVGLAPHDAGEILVEIEPLSQFKRLPNPTEEELRIKILPAAGEPAGDNLRVGIVDRAAERTVVEILQRDHVSRLRIAEGFFHLRGVHPFVSVENSGAGSDDEAGHDGGRHEPAGQPVASTDRIGPPNAVPGGRVKCPMRARDLRSADWISPCYRLRPRIKPLATNTMGQQSNKIIKRNRRKKYLKRKKEQSKLGGIVKKTAAPKKSEAAAKKPAPAKKAAAKKAAKKAPAKKAAKSVEETTQPEETGGEE